MQMPAPNPRLFSDGAILFSKEQKSYLKAKGAGFAIAAQDQTTSAFMTGLYAVYFDRWPSDVIWGEIFSLEVQQFRMNRRREVSY